MDVNYWDFKDVERKVSVLEGDMILLKEESHIMSEFIKQEVGLDKFNRFKQYKELEKEFGENDK